MSDLLALAARCEAAEGPDRALDFAIAEAIGPELWVGRGQSVPAYPTASLDAAMTLVPEGWRWTLFHEGVVSLKPDVAFCAHPEHRSNGIEKRADAATPALALCAAALKARAAQ